MSLVQAYYYQKFELLFRSTKGNEFQAFFEKLMNLAYPGDFMPCKPWGNRGDRKNDGFLKSEKRLFQVYAPNEMKEYDAVKKIKEDFEGALPYWGEHFEKWVFAHNATDGRLPPHVQKIILDFETKYTGITFETWGLTEFISVFRIVSEEDKISWFGSPPIDDSFASQILARLDHFLPPLSGPKKVEAGFDGPDVIVEPLNRIHSGSEGTLVPTSYNKHEVDNVIRDVEGDAEADNPDLTQKKSSRFGQIFNHSLAVKYASEIHMQLGIWNEGPALFIADKLAKMFPACDKPFSLDLYEYAFLIARVHVICAEKGYGDKYEHIRIAKSYLERISNTEPDSSIYLDAAALRASIMNLENGPDEAFKIISELKTPYVNRVRIALHLTKNDAEGAVALIEKLEPHTKWCDLAIATFVLLGRLDDANNLLEWVKLQKDGSKYSQCIVHYSDAALDRIATNFDHLPSRIASDDTPVKDDLLSLLQVLSPILGPVLAKRSIDSGLEEAAVRVSWRAYHFLGDREKICEISMLLLDRTPLPLDAARSVVHGYIQPPEGISSRMREEHTDNFEAYLLAVLIELQVGKHLDAFFHARELVKSADSESRKDELFRVFQQLGHELEGKEVQECEQISERLASSNPDLLKMNEAAMAIRAGDGQVALDYLDDLGNQEDVYATQLRGNALLSLKRTREAADTFYALAQQTGRLHFYQVTADLAFEAANFELAAECSERIAALQPENLASRRNLASLYISNFKDMEKAEAHFRALYENEPEKAENAINLALCLANLYRPEESLSIFDEACGLPDPDLQVVLGRSQLLMNLGRPIDAYQRLEDFRDSMWYNPRFLLVFQGIAYAAGEEDAAAEAFSTLNALRSEGKVDENTFRALPAEEGIKLVQEQMEASRKQNEHLHEQMLHGRMPWIWAAEVKNEAIYWAWRSRTWEYLWVGANPINRANYCLYATNGFHVREDEGGHRTLLPLQCPASGGKVVVDFSALITLHRLGLLEQAANWFEEILLPQAYLESVVEDGGKMVPTQRSRETHPWQIKQAILKDRIQIVDSDVDLPIVDEHDQSEADVYRLIDVVEPIYSAGLIEESRFERVRRVCGKDSAVNEEHPSFTSQRVIRIERTSLETLTAVGLLDTVTDFYQIRVPEGTLRELNDQIQGIRMQEETRTWHYDLWDTIRDHPRFRFVPHAIPSDLLETASQAGDIPAFVATFVARDQGLPLLADDRMCQAFVLNDSKNPNASAFGSDALVQALSDEERIDADREADAFVSLMRWRYRFMVPPSRVLVNLARRYRNALPGAPLRLIAAYVHDCMRDAGLFGGAENTDQGESMAMRLWLAWSTRCAEFLVAIWSDEDVDENQAKTLTRWCVNELYPSAPKVINGEAKVRFADMSARLLISHLLLNMPVPVDEVRMSLALQTVQQALSLSNEEYAILITGVLQDANRS